MEPLGEPDTTAAVVPLPAQPAGVAWPTGAWPQRRAPSAVAALLDEAFGDEARYGTTYAVVVIHAGHLVAERYQGALPNWLGPDTPVTAATPLLSWSMAKSILHAATGILAGRGRLHPDRPAPVAAWQGDARAGITLEHLLAMRDGLDFREDYTDEGASHVIDMLFGAGAGDVAAYAMARPLAHRPGSTFNYSSGTSNVVARLCGDAVGGGEAGMRAFLAAELFGPVGMASADPRFDAAGTFVGSSYVHANARDFARFGLLYLRDGVWAGRRLLPEGWVDHARRLRSVDPSDGSGYGAHWWVAPGDPRGSFWASGFEGQSILCVPAVDAVVVRLGRSPDDAHKAALASWRSRVVDALAT